MKVMMKPPYQTIKHESLWNTGNNIYEGHRDKKQNISRETAQVESIRGMKNIPSSSIVSIYSLSQNDILTTHNCDVQVFPLNGT